MRAIHSIAEISDHFPVWVQVKTDIEGQRLNQIVQHGRKE